MSQRSKAREIALRVLYQDDLDPKVNPAQTDAYITRQLPREELAAFARSLVRGVREKRQVIDEMIKDAAANWSLERMAVTDRNVIRIGIFELLFTEVPARIAINEAIELGRRYGTGESGRFINGILDRVMQLAGKEIGDPPEEEEGARD